MPAKEYRDHAAECIDWAKTARSEKERLIFIEMANTWLKAAAVAERSDASVGSEALQPAS